MGADNSLPFSGRLPSANSRFFSRSTSLICKPAGALRAGETAAPHGAGQRKGGLSLDRLSATALLDHLAGLFACVAARKDGRILYLNSRCREALPAAEEGGALASIWPALTGRRPAGWQVEEPCSFLAANTPFGPGMEVSLFPLLWGEEPACLICAAPQLPTPAQQETVAERERLAAAMARVYPMVISVNLTQNHYAMVAYEHFDSHQAAEEGCFDQLIEVGASTMHPLYRAEFTRTFSRENLLNAFAEGVEERYMQHLQLGDDGVYHWTETRVLPLPCAQGEDQWQITLCRNIDSEKQAQEELESSFAVATENAGGLTAKFLVEGGQVLLLEASRRYRELFGVGERECREGMFSQLPAPLREKFTAQVCRAAAKRATVDMEIPVSWEGKTRWYHGQASCVGEKGGCPIYFGTAVDVTERRQLERDREATYDSLPGGIAKFALAGELPLLETNRAFHTLLGLPADAVGRGLLTLVLPEEREALRQTLETQHRQGLPLRAECRVEREGGHPFWMHLEGRRVGGVENAPVYLAVLLDVTLRREAQQKREREQARYQLAVESSADALFVYDLKSDLFTSRKGGSEGSRQALPRYLETLEEAGTVHPDDFEKVRAMMAGQLGRAEVRMRRPGETDFSWFLYQGDAVRQGERVIQVVGTLRDIGRLKEEEARRTLLQQVCNFVGSRDYQLLAVIDLPGWECHCVYRDDSSLFALDGDHFAPAAHAFVARSVCPWDRERMAAALQPQSILSGLGEQGAHILYLQALEKDGSLRWKELSFSHFRGQKDTLLMALQDVEEVRAAETRGRIADGSLEVALNQIYDEVLCTNITRRQMVYAKSRGTYPPISRGAETAYRQVLANIHPSERETFAHTLGPENLLATFAAGQPSVGGEFRRKGTDGNYHWVAMTAVQLSRQAGGEVMTLLLTSTIDARKQMEQAREEFTTGVTALFEECVTLNVTQGRYLLRKSDATWGLIPSEGVFEETNETYCRQLVHPDDQPLFLAAFSLESIRRQLAEGAQRVMRTLRRKDRSGQYRWVEMTMIRLENHVDSDQKVLLVYQDVHRLKTAQEQQREADLRFSSAVSAFYDAVFEGDLETDQVFLWSRQNGSLTQSPLPYRLEENFHWTVEHLVHPNDREAYLQSFAPEALKRAFARGRKEVYLEALRRPSPDRDYRWYSMQAQEISRKPGSCRVMFYLKDMDEAKRQEERRRTALMDALELAERANQAKTEFLSRMSHDIRTPMNAIIGMARIAKESLGEPEKAADCLEKVDVSAKFLLSLINDVLDMSQIESGKIHIAREPFDTAPFLQGIEAVCAPQARARGQRFSISAAGLAPAYLGDALRLNQILMNLLSNALKYTPEGGSISLEAAPAEGSSGKPMVRFRVVDSGQGMSKDFLKRMYEPFEQETSGGGRSPGSSGLGLTIARNLTHLMDGQISVESEVGRGTVFTVTLPLLPATPHEDRPEPPREEEPAFAGEHLLLVEDNEINREIALALLHSRGLSVDTAADGTEAVKRFSQSALGFYRAVLMDIRMPVMDGIEATERIRALPRPDAAAVPIIAMTANAFQEEVERAKLAGMSDYLAKPVDPPILFDALYRALHPISPQEGQKK